MKEKTIVSQDRNLRNLSSFFLPGNPGNRSRSKGGTGISWKTACTLVCTLYGNGGPIMR